MNIYIATLQKDHSTPEIIATASNLNMLLEKFKLADDYPNLFGYNPKYDIIITKHMVGKMGCGEEVGVVELTDEMNGDGEWHYHFEWIKTGSKKS